MRSGCAFANGIALAPPFRRVWTFRARNLVEFPPAVAYGRLFFANNAGVAVRDRREDGQARVEVRRRTAASAASPAVDGHVVYETFLNGPPCNREAERALDGELVAFAVGYRPGALAQDDRPVGVLAGRRRRPRLRRRLERRRLRASTQRTGRAALVDARARQGEGRGRDLRRPPLLRRLLGPRLRARTRAPGKLHLEGEGAAAVRRTRATSTRRRRVAYGRVYIGSTDGKVYSFGAASGKLRWSQSTGGYVYSSPAVWRDRVFVGSYSQRFYCFDAATGDVLWQFKANGPISGSPTVIAGRVYFATLEGRTYALDARPARRSGRSRTASTRRSSPMRSGSTSSATRGSTGSTRAGARTTRRRTPRRYARLALRRARVPTPHASSGTTSADAVRHRRADSRRRGGENGLPHRARVRAPHPRGARGLRNRSAA